jgi:hypothetical protein
MFESTWAHRRAMAPPAQSDLAEMSSFEIPTSAPTRRVACRKRDVISTGRTGLRQRFQDLAATEVDDLANDCFDGAAMCGAAACMVNNFAADSILLRGEDEGGGRGSGNVGDTGSDGADKPGANPQLDVAEAEGRVVCGGAGIFAWAKQVEKGGDGHVCDGFCRF